MKFPLQVELIERLSPGKLGSLKVEEWENVMKEVKNAKFIKEFDKKIIGELEGRVVLSEESGKIENLLEIAEKSDKMSIFSIGESEELMKFKGKTMNFKNIVKIETIDQKTFTENLLINSITQAFHDFSLHLVKPSSTKPHNPNKKTLYVFIPMGIPCMGKSHFLPIFANFFEEKGFEFHTISSDLIHKELIDEQFKKNQNKKNVDFEEIHDKTTKKAKSLFIERFSSLMKKINTSKNTLQVLFVDKNHPPNGIDKAMGLITADGAKNVDLKIIAIAPFFENGSKIHNLPFSLGFVETCLKRSLARPEHETLRGDAIKVFDIILMFCRMYKGFKMSSEYLKSLGFDDLWLLPYHKEKIIEGEEKEMKNLESCLNNRGNIKELISWIEGKEVGEEVGEAEFREKLKGGWEKMEGSQEENMDEEMWDSCQEENDENFD